jgi:hypothetical protein
MKRSRPRSISEQISRYHALSLHLDREYRVLLSVFELLNVATEEDLQKRIRETERISGFKVVAD